MILRTLLDRYIFTELLSPFGLSLGALCFVMLTRELLRLVELLVSKGVGFLAVLKVIAMLLPSGLVLTLPIAGLIASITAFGRLSFDKELVAMRAAGLSLLRLSQPVLLFSILVCTLTLVLSHWGQPWSSLNLKKVALNLLKDQLVLALEQGTFNEPIPHMMIYVPESEPGHPPDGIFISDERLPNEPRVIVAQQYHVFMDSEHEHVALRLINGTIHSRPGQDDQYRQIAFASYDIKINLNLSSYSATEERPSYDQIMARLAETDGKDAGALRRLMEYYKDLAFPTASLVFCLLGVPVGIVSKRSGRVGGFAVGVGIIIAFYILNVGCDFLVTALILHPFLGAWLPNIIFVMITVGMFVRMSRQ
ncbi:MAG: LPS export ABC transporter permease LptF [Nitrospira sp.]|nr:LPS export ABC transporter permease LptF [Nitrospira sp.]MDH4368762.1 LPS export ABC transporter permease LptF [Nitrospira sp.]MDH5346888.1 LPS export ABC transporter permease LptF [Nitrospira sp.]MDH5498065.1 LPS export ABC transporter permease LptF [Nitrospira sp.]